MYVCMYSFFNVNYRTKLTAFFQPGLQIKIEKKNNFINKLSFGTQPNKLNSFRGSLCMDETNLSWPVVPRFIFTSCFPKVILCIQTSRINQNNHTTSTSFSMSAILCSIVPILVFLASRTGRTKLTQITSLAKEIC